MTRTALYVGSTNPTIQMSKAVRTVEARKWLSSKTLQPHGGARDKRVHQTLTEHRQPGILSGLAEAPVGGLEDSVTGERRRLAKSLAHRTLPGTLGRDAN